MTGAANAPLDEQALNAAELAWTGDARLGLYPEQKAALANAIRAYLAASPSPSEMEVVEGLLSDGQPLVTLSQAQSALAAMREKLAIAERNRDAGRDNFHTMQQSAADLAAQVLRLTEENEALRKERTSLIETKREQIGRLELSRGAASKIALDAIARAEAAEARIKALEEALRPFASVADALPEDQFANSYTPAGKDVLPSMRSFRLARTTLQKEQADAR